MEPAMIVLLGGVLPFGSIFIEMYFIFTSFWAYKIYYVYGFMLLVFIILMIVTVCVTIVAVYFLLNSEDYRWCMSLPLLLTLTNTRLAQQIRLCLFQAMDKFLGWRFVFLLCLSLLHLLFLFQN